MKIYIDSNYHCHITNPDGAYLEIETDFFNGKCDTFIEGYLYVPIGESCILPGGTTVLGGYIAPWKPYSELDAVQREYERQLLSQYKTQNEEYKEALQTLNVEV